jgi:hypothetical protein
MIGRLIVCKILDSLSRTQVYITDINQVRISVSNLESNET